MAIAASDESAMDDVAGFAFNCFAIGLNIGVLLGLEKVVLMHVVFIVWHIHFALKAYRRLA